MGITGLSEAARAGNEEIRRKLEAGEPEVVREWLERFARYVRRNWSRVANQAEHLAHDALVTAVERLDEFSGQVPISDWLYGVARNTARRADRTFERRKGPETGTFEDLERHPEPPSEDDCADAVANRMYVRGFVERLDPEQQLLIQRRYYEDSSWADIASEFGISESAIQSRHQRILMALGAWITEEEPWLVPRRDR